MAKANSKAKIKTGRGPGRTVLKRQGSWTEKKKLDFCTLLVAGWTVIDACKSVGMSQSSVYELRERDEEFMRQMQQAYDDSTAMLEGECFQRAVGRDEPMMDKDGEIHYRKKYSDLLMMFLLKARKPKMYRDQVDININETRHIIVDLLPVVKDEETGKLMVVGEEQPPLLASGEGESDG